MAITSGQLQTLKDAIEIAAGVPAAPDCNLICATVDFIKDEGTQAQLDELCKMSVVEDCNCSACSSSP